MQQLQNYLLRQHAANRKVLVIIEEAQGMPVETLEEIRLFSNLETHRDKLMQIILFGQPELDRNLSASNIRQLRERITHSFYLQPMNRKEVAEYIRFRVSAAGCPCPRLFSPSAEWLISKAASGLSRRVNILADKALLAAFAENILEGSEQLSAQSKPVVGIKHVIAAIRDSEYSASVLHSLVFPLRLLGATMLIALVAVILWWPESLRVASQNVPASPAQLSDERFGEIDQVAASQTEVVAINEAESLEVPKPTIAPLPIASGLEPLAKQNEVDLPISGEASTADTFDAEAPVMNSVMQITTSSTESEFFPDASSLLSVRSLLQERMLASIPWLHKAAGNGYTVHFMSGDSSDLDSAGEFLQVLLESSLLDQSYVCMSSTGSESYWTIKYGNFAGRNNAENFITQLPEQIRNFAPFAQNISSVVCNTNHTIAALMLE